MNQLLLLEDRINLLTERCGLVIAKRDIPFRDMKIDLGFQHRLIGDYNDESFYSIPILDFLKLGYENSAEVETKILQHCAAHASARLQNGVIGPQRLLIRYAGNKGSKLKLAEVSTPEYRREIKGRFSESTGYWHGNFQQLVKRVPDFADYLQRAEQEFQALMRH